MARSFANAQQTYLTGGVTPVSGTGARTVCWRFRTSGADGLQMWGWEGGATTGAKYQCRFDTSRLRLEVQGAAWVGTATPDDGAWHAVAFATPASDDLSGTVCYLDGSADTRSNSGTATINTGTSNNLTIGNTPGGLATSTFDGDMAEYAVWDVELTTAELVMLTGGLVSPLLVRPESLVYFVPFVRDEDRDIVGGDTLSVTGTGSVSVADHPRVFYPRRSRGIALTPGGGGGGGSGNPWYYYAQQ